MAIIGREQFSGKSVHIIGMARSGMAAAEALVTFGASVTVHDQKDACNLAKEMSFCKRLGISTMVGDAAYDGIGSADYVVISPGVPPACPGLVEADRLGIPVLPEIELAYRISRAPIAAVTGTNGKTTTTALLGSMLKSAYPHVYIAGNIVAGDIRMPLVKAAASAMEDDIIAAEISSFQLERITSFKPKVGALLNVSNDHLDRHPSIDAYAAMKARMFEFQDANDYAVLNMDNALVMKVCADIKAKTILFSSNSEPIEGLFYRHGHIIWRRLGEDYVICSTESMKLRGIHNIENVMAAAACAAILNVGVEAIQKAVDEFMPLEHRLEPVASINGVEFLNNSMCTNVEAAVSSLEAVGKPAIVIAGGKDKGDDYTRLGEAFRKYAKHVVLIGVDAGLIEDAAKRAGFTSIEKAGTLKEAVDAAWEHASPGDSIVLSPGCASFDMFRNFEDRGIQFKSAVNELMRRVGGRG